MNNLRAKLNQPVVIGALAFILGLLIGWIGIGWGVWPVEWKDAPVNLLRTDIQEDVMMWAINSYDDNPDPALAQKLIDDLGPERAQELFSKVQVTYKGKLNADGVKAFQDLLPGAAQAPASDATPAGEVAPTAEPKKGEIDLTVVFGLLCLFTLVVGGLLAYLFFFRNKMAKNEPRGGGGSAMRAAPAPSYETGQEPPVVQYLTTYTIGNDLYDDSFSIDSPTGEFLGECGVGISETIGVGDPKKVTAFEVWLFDKNDIQTVTKVLMSGHAFNDPVISQRLASKGEPVQADPGKRVILETATLRLEARVVSMNYGQGALPQSSFFDQMTLELAVWQKKA
jgi:hypothetical protein